MDGSRADTGLARIPGPVRPAAAVERLHPSLGLRARFGLSWTLSWAATCFALDALMIGAALIATELGERLSGAAAVPPGAGEAFAALTLILFHARGLYGPRLRLDLLGDAGTALLQVTVAAMAVLSVTVVVDAGSGSLTNETVWGLVRLWGFAAAYVVAGRTALYWSQVRARRNGDVVSPTVVVGADEVGRRVARRLLEHRDLGLLPVGFVQPHAEAEATREGEVPVPVLGSTDEIDRIVDDFDVTQVVVNSAGGLVDEDLLPMIERCERLGVAVAFVPGAHEKITRNLRVEHVGGLPLITAYATDPQGWQFAVKYALDRVVAAALLLLAAPVLLAAAAAVYLSLGRPILFRQTRIGRDGRAFDVLKFRTMREGEPDADAPVVVDDGVAPGGVEGPDRRTRTGAFLRRSSIDELPQLVNVLAGDMSLVGPRPERPEYARGFARTVHRYGDRHRVKSGITGWAQVNGLRGKTSIEDRAEWDNYYIENFSLWLDLKILLLTVRAVLRPAE